MRNTLKLLLAGTLAAASVAVVPAAQAGGGDAYALTEVLIPGQDVVQPQDITNSGVIVGHSGDTTASVAGGDDVHGFVLRRGALSVVDRPGTRWTYLTGITENGVASGFSGPFNQAGFALGQLSGFTFADDAFVPVVHGAYAVTFVTGINDRGHVIGFSSDGNGAPNAFEWVDGATTDLTGPNGEHVYAGAINDPNTVLVGHGASVWALRHGDYTPVKVALPNVAITDVNNGGTLVGSYRDANGGHGFVANHDAIVTLDYPGATETRVNGINDRGDVVGEFLSAGVWRGFVGKRT